MEEPASVIQVSDGEWVVQPKVITKAVYRLLIQFFQGTCADHGYQGVPRDQLLTEEGEHRDENDDRYGVQATANDKSQQIVLGRSLANNRLQP